MNEKLIKGRKSIYGDTSGNFLESFVASVNCYHGSTAVKCWDKIRSE
ncbi:hypothetical protein LIV57_20760 [Chryseobacterium sp. X308]|nr:hypothetical protein [Chryseobacterium sp. X308]MCC3217700.1 hypothetical protein [Chryseobacterium sp. X308]